jgi:hypothetical protein
MAARNYCWNYSEAEIGAHARTAIGVAELPLGLPVVISAEVALTAKASISLPT